MSYMTTGEFIVFETSVTTDHTASIEIDKRLYGRRSTDIKPNFYNNDPYVQPCAFDSLPEDCKGKPMMLYCSCPRCSPTY